MSTGFGADALDEVFRPVVDRHARTQLQAGRTLLIRAGRRIHDGAECARELNGGRPDAARSAVDENALSRLQPATLEQIRPHGEIRFGDCRGGDDVRAVGDWQALLLGDGAELRVAASRDECADAVALAPPPRTGDNGA
jgi:hypothetical protein